jgi:hypothetical protein
MTTTDRLTAQMAAAGLVDYLVTVDATDTQWRGQLRLEVIPYLAADPRFAQGPLHQLHPEVGTPRTEFRSYNGALGTGSLQVVINTQTGAFYADVDKHNPYNDVVRFLGHAFGEVVPGFAKRLWRGCRGLTRTGWCLLLLASPAAAQTPYMAGTVAEVDRAHPHLLRTNDTPSVAQFRRLVVIALNAAQPGLWGELTKGPGEHQHQGLSVDSLCYLPTWQVIDVVANAEAVTSPGRPAWQEQPRRETNLCIPLPGGVSPDPEPAPIDITPLVEQVARLQQEVRDISAALYTLQLEVRDRILLLEHGHANHDGRIGVIESRGYPVYVGSLFGIRITSRPVLP